MPGFTDSTSYAKLVELMSIDLRPYGDQIYYFCSTGTVVWSGITWLGLPFESTGWKKGGDQPERPKVNVPDYEGQLELVLKSCRNGIGAEVNRYQVLDPTQGVAAPYTLETYQLASFGSTGYVISMELATALDITSAEVLGFKMLRDDYPGLGSQLLN